jgi:hypothetical protein
VAKTYRRHLGTRLINWWFRTLTRLGLGASYRHILTVPGRKTGRLHSTPVQPGWALARQWAGFEQEVEQLKKEIARLRQLITRAAHELRDAGADQKSRRLLRALDGG